MNTKEYWKWLNDFATLIQNMLDEIEKTTMRTEEKDVDVGTLAQLRISERVLNFFIDQFMYELDKENMPLIEFFAKEVGEKENPMLPWNTLKATRDILADRISNLIEKNPRATERYGEFCENLKNIRNLGAVL